MTWWVLVIALISNNEVIEDQVHQLRAFTSKASCEQYLSENYQTFTPTNNPAYFIYATCIDDQPSLLIEKELDT